MDNYCENCKHAGKWTDAEKLEYLNEIYNLCGRLPLYDVDHYICDKIKKGASWVDEDFGEFTYDGYSLEGECYDEIFHCFEPKEVQNEN